MDKLTMLCQCFLNERMHPVSNEKQDFRKLKGKVVFLLHQFLVGGRVHFLHQSISIQFTSIAFKTYSWGIKGFNTPQSVCSKTTLIASSVSGAGVNPPFCKMGTFFLRSLALSIPIYRNFQSNGDKWRSLKLRKNIFVQ